MSKSIASRDAIEVTNELPTSPGTYALILHLPRTRRLSVGRLGTHNGTC